VARVLLEAPQLPVAGEEILATWASKRRDALGFDRPDDRIASSAVASFTTRTTCTFAPSSGAATSRRRGGRGQRSVSTLLRGLSGS
jgi:hypothetical protein